MLRSATSVGANYREANNALSYKDFLHRIRIARKEAKETLYWLQLLSELEPPNADLIQLIDESKQLIRILSSIIRNKKDIKSEF